MGTNNVATGIEQIDVNVLYISLTTQVNGDVDDDLLLGAIGQADWLRVDGTGRAWSIVRDGRIDTDCTIKVGPIITQVNLYRDPIAVAKACIKARSDLEDWSIDDGGCSLGSEGSIG